MNNIAANTVATPLDKPVRETNVIQNQPEAIGPIVGDHVAGNVFIRDVRNDIIRDGSRRKVKDGRPRKYTQRDIVRLRSVFFRMPFELHARFRMKLFKEGEIMGDVLNRLIEAWVMRLEWDDQIDGVEDENLGVEFRKDRVELAPDEIMERIADIATTDNDTDIDTE